MSTQQIRIRKATPHAFVHKVRREAGCSVNGDRVKDASFVELQPCACARVGVRQCGRVGARQGYRLSGGQMAQISKYWSFEKCMQDITRLQIEELMFGDLTKFDFSYLVG